MSEQEIINKVTESGIVTIDLEEFMIPGERVAFDIKPLLFQEMILKEKDLRDFIKTKDWSEYNGKVVSLYCSNDAIVPTWAYMLLALAIQPYALKVVFSDPKDTESLLLTERLALIDPETYRNARVVIKGCGSTPIPVQAYILLSAKLKPVAKSIMYGEPCSTVPLYKSK